MKSELVKSSAGSAPSPSVFAVRPETGYSPNLNKTLIWEINKQIYGKTGPFSADDLFLAIQPETEKSGIPSSNVTFVFGPLNGSERASDSTFYFPDPRPGAVLLAPNENFIPSSKDDPIPSEEKGPVDAKAAEELPRQYPEK